MFSPKLNLPQKFAKFPSFKYLKEDCLLFSWNIKLLYCKGAEQNVFYCTAPLVNLDLKWCHCWTWSKNTFSIKEPKLTTVAYPLSIEIKMIFVFRLSTNLEQIRVRHIIPSQFDWSCSIDPSSDRMADQQYFYWTGTNILYTLGCVIIKLYTYILVNLTGKHVTVTTTWQLL